MRKMAEIGHSTTYLEIPGAGHLVHDDAPEVYRRAVEDFLRSV